MGRPKIYYNIDESIYIYHTDNYIYYFSSKFYLDKFVEELKTNRSELKYKLSSRFNIEINCIDYFDFILYSKIEKRGFKVDNKITREVVTCLSQVKLDGEIKTLKNLKE